MDDNLQNQDYSLFVYEVYRELTQNLFVFK